MKTPLPVKNTDLYPWLEPKEKPWLHLGCGSKHIKDAVNADSNPECQPDSCFDMNGPWPFEENTFGWACAICVMEHMTDILHSIGELWRVLKMGGRADIITPYWQHPAAVEDPTHVRFFGKYSAGYFKAEMYQHNTSWYTEDRFNFVCVDSRLIGDPYLKDETKELIPRLANDNSPAAQWLVHMIEQGNMPGFWRWALYRLEKHPLPEPVPLQIFEITLPEPRGDQ